MNSLHRIIARVAPEVNWESHSLGPVHGWPESLKTATAMMLNSAFPMFISWGKERIFLYNQAYVPVLGRKHPAAFGKKFADIWAEIWADIEPLILSVDQGKAVFLEDLDLLMNRHGFDEKTNFTFSYSPITGEVGEVLGLFCACVETTKRIQLEKDLQAERLKVEASLTQDKNRLLSLLENIPGGVAYLEGRDLLFAFANSRYRKMFLEAADPIGKTVLEVLPDSVEQGYYQILTAVFNTGERYEGVKAPYSLLSPTGEKTTFYLNFVYEPVYGADGQIDGILAVIHDVTETVEVEQKLVASEQRLKSVFTQAMVGICETDFTGRFLRANDFYCSMVGRTREELLQLRMQEITHPDDLGPNLEKFLRLKKTGEGFEIEKRYLRPDGSVIWVHNNVSSINNEFVVAISTDITAKKTAQIEFEKNVDVSPAILWITDTDGKCTYLSKQWTDFTGQSLEEGLGFGWLECTHPEDKERAGKIFRDSNAKQEPFYVEYRLRTKAGDYHWAIDAGTPRFDKQGRYQGYAGSVFDVHDRKLAELKVEAEMQNLEAAVRARDEFLSIASHELKTPLTSLQLQAQMHRRSIEKKRPEVFQPKTMIDYVNLTEHQTLRLTRLVDDMLDVSRIRTGKLTLRHEEFDLREMLRDLLERMKDQFEKAGFPVPTFEASSEVLGCWDRMRIEQVAMNLLTNALRYGEKRPITVTLSQDRETATLSVTDRGIGIAPENHDKIFNRFERAVSANEISGLGLGLFITKQIVVAHKGQIGVESELGQGSKFTVRLPKEYHA